MLPRTFSELIKLEAFSELILFTMYVILAMAVISGSVFGLLEEPKCMSQFDYEHKLLYKLIKIEEDVRNFRNFIDEMKAKQTQTDTEQKEKFEKALGTFKSTADVQLLKSAEESRKLLTDMEESLDNMNETFQKLSNRPTIGFSVKGPAAGPFSGETTFTTVITNPGDSFNLTTGRFTCTTAGYYYFVVSLFKVFHQTSHIHCWMYKNNDKLVGAHANPGHSPKKGHYSAVNSAFVHLDTGDTVYLAGCTPLSSLNSYSSFNGFLVKADSVLYP